MKIVLACVVTAAVGSGMAFAAPPALIPPKPAAARTPVLRLTPNTGVVRSCARELTVKAQLDNNELHSKYGATYNASNLNEVKVFVTGSNVVPGVNELMCHYASQNRDIFNLTYRIPCPGATPANNGYEHAYRCNN
ncbi:MAG: hypothetical protein PHQ91_08275 [Thermoanaerobaculaceae bacterium]|nr:hypothetical protein [Thermoanaerobaculaceae bacterium]TAM49933.1 MAG: hypothetical protein EPN53_07875 [Acidobacteriota bacterium]